MLSFLIRHPPRTKVSHLQKLVFDDGRASATFRREGGGRYLVANRLPPAPTGNLNATTSAVLSTKSPAQRNNAAGGLVNVKETSTSSSSVPRPPLPLPHPPNCSLNPPWHIHRFQDEHFRVVRGTAVFYLNGPPRASLGSWFMLADEEKKNGPSGSSDVLRNSTTSDVEIMVVGADGTIVIPRGTSHTFRNASSQEELIVEFGLEPTKTSDEVFFRNVWSYREDCRKAGVGMSVFQAMVFNQAAGNTMGLAVGPSWLARAVSVGVTGVGAWLGRWVLGLRGSYGEYYDQSSGKEK